MLLLLLLGSFADDLITGTTDRNGRDLSGMSRPRDALPRAAQNLNINIRISFERVALLAL